MRNRAGTSFIELVIVLMLLSMLLGIALSTSFHWRDVLAVRAARDELASGFASARVTAAAAGGAALFLDQGNGLFWVATATGAGAATDLSRRYGVRFDGDEALVEFRYDALGIGRLTNRTVRLRRGSAEGGVIVSAYGRVRRW